MRGRASCRVMIEVAGHVPINQLEQNARWQEICFKGRMLYSSLGSGKPTLSSVGRGTGPPLPRLSGVPRRIWAPRPLSSASYAVPGKCRAVQSPHLYRREASRKVGSAISSERCWKTSPPIRGLRAELTANRGMPAVPRFLARLERFGFARRSRQQRRRTVDAHRSRSRTARRPHTDDQGTCTAHVRITPGRAV